MRTREEDELAANAIILNMLEASASGVTPEIQWKMQRLLLGKVHPADIGLVNSLVTSLLSLIEIQANEMGQNPIDFWMSCITGDS